MMESTTPTDTTTTPITETTTTNLPVDTELTHLNIADSLRANSSFMKIMATLFHYGNQAMNAAQLVIAVRALNLLPLRGETPKSTIQGIISTSRKIARDLKLSDPFRIDKDGSGRQAKYAIADQVLNGIEPPEKMEIPDEPIILRPVHHSHTSSYHYQGTKRERKARSIYSPTTRPSQKKKRTHRPKKKDMDRVNSDIEVDSDQDEDFHSMQSFDDDEDELNGNTPSCDIVEEEDTIVDYSLLYNPPTKDMDYIDPIDFTAYPIAGHFAIVQQKGYSYPRFRSHEKIKIPKVHCEDKFRVTDIVSRDKVVGRLFMLADGHGGPGCSEYFVRNTPEAVNRICVDYDPAQLGDREIQQRLETDIKTMIQTLDDAYLAIKREQMANKASEDHVDNDGCTLILNVFLGEWLINVNVGDSRTVLISAPEPSSSSTHPSITATTTESSSFNTVDHDYKMDVVFASQDHKPYLEHLARHILENGGEFVDSVQNRVIKVDLDKLREDGNRHAKRLALKNARIRPKDYQASCQETEEKASNNNWTAQSAVRTTATSPPPDKLRIPIREDRIPSLNVARSCGDLDFKMDSAHKIISCEPDVTFIRISDQPYVDHTILLNGPHKEKRRHFLFMSTDGTFDYMYEETAERQNRAIAKVIGPMIEDGEKVGRYLLEEEEEAKKSKGQTIEHNKEPEQMEVDELMNGDVSHGKYQDKTEETGEIKEETEDKTEETEDKTEETGDIKEETQDMKEETQDLTEETQDKNNDVTDNMEVDKEELPRIPLLFRELTEEEAKTRKIKERTLVSSARYFANRESAHGFFASTLQDYDDCTIILVEI